MSTRPELIYLPADGGAALDEALAAATVVAIGPGLGRGDWAQRLWSRVQQLRQVPVVADADALNLLAREPVRLPANWILTPHPGEAARLLAADTAAVQGDRLAAVRDLHARYGAVAVLKGAGTLVAGTVGDTVELSICDRGNPGMATAGMGDVLTGVISGLLAQLAGGAVATAADALRAARLGVLVHALAGDAAAQGGQRGLIASDVIAELRGWVNP
jgi:NAD(P)H-hydrate epimerase